MAYKWHFFTIKDITPGINPYRAAHPVRTRNGHRQQWPHLQPMSSAHGDGHNHGHQHPYSAHGKEPSKANHTRPPATSHRHTQPHRATSPAGIRFHLASTPYRATHPVTATHPRPPTPIRRTRQRTRHGQHTQHRQPVTTHHGNTGQRGNGRRGNC